MKSPTSIVHPHHTACPSLRSHPGSPRTGLCSWGGPGWETTTLSSPPSSPERFNKCCHPERAKRVEGPAFGSLANHPSVAAGCRCAESASPEVEQRPFPGTKKAPPGESCLDGSRSGKPEGRGAAITKKRAFSKLRGLGFSSSAEAHCQHIFWTGKNYRISIPVGDRFHRVASPIIPN
jgi:hypothetical protein